MIHAKTKDKSATAYRRRCFVTSAIALSLAFLSKYYNGPHFRFADAYLGDLFIVICLYFVLAGFILKMHIRQKLSSIAVIACSVEFLQWTKIPAQLNLGEPFVFILGTSYDPQDFIFYGLGLTMAGLLDKTFIRFREGGNGKF